MAANSKKSVMDVSKPGKSPADATARPIITGHAIMKDPMVNEDKVPLEGVTEEVPAKPEPEVTEEKVAAPSANHRVIQPLSVSEDEKKEEPAEEEVTADAPEKPEAPEEKPEEKKEETPVTEDAVVDAVLDQVGDKKEETKESEEERKRQEVVDKLIEEKKYFVPINQVHSRRNNRLALLVLGALLPVIVGLGLAADAGVINLGFKVPFDFIKDKTPTTTTQTVTPVQPAVTETKPLLTEFTNKDLGVSFSYPQAWGTITVKDNSTEKTEKGKRSLLSFSTQPKVLIGLKQATWKDSSTDVNRACTQPGFTAYQKVTTDEGNGRFVLKSQDASQVYEELTGGLCSDMQVVGDVKFTKNTIYTGLSVVYQDKIKDSFDLAQRIADWQKNKTKYFPVTLTDQITALVATVKEQ